MVIRRFGEAVRADQRYRSRPGAYVILERDGLFLLTFQEAPEPEFQLPGGGINPGEHPVPALHREVYEETGYTMGAPRKLGVYKRYCYLPEYGYWAEKVCHIYTARPIQRLGPPLEKGHTAVWATLEEALVLLTNEGDNWFVANYFGN